MMARDERREVAGMRTSSAEAKGYRCPECGDDTSRDPANKGFVRHVNNPNCDFERGQRDHPA
jgi:ssDNA-binding Zn-finger/Zn-ribbon topoisomerase 1